MMIIGKFGGAPFSTQRTAIDFKNKYSIKGELIEYKYGYGIVVECNKIDLSQEQIENRLLATIIDGEVIEMQRAGSYLDRTLSKYKIETNEFNTKSISVNDNTNINKITFNDIKLTIHECYKRKDDLDDATAKWLKRLTYVIEKNGSEALYNQTLGRLYGIAKRLNINI